MIKILILTIMMFCSTDLWSHTRWSLTGNVTPRSTSPGIKNGPCGGIAKGIGKIFQAGTTITVQWEETINHPGRFEIYFSAANDANFQLLKTLNDNQDDSNTPHQYSTTIALPNVSCTACTLQIIQVMTENPASPSLYYSCADIQLQAVVPTGPPAPGSPPVQGQSDPKCH